MDLLDIPVISTALALIVSWALFAILCSMLQEAVAEMKAERGRFMKKYLFQQFQDLPNGVNWASILYLHGTINLLSREFGRPTNEIPPRLFAEALVDAVSRTHLIQVQRKNETSTESFDTHTPLAELPTFRQPVLANFKLATQLLNPSDTVSLFNQALTSAELKAGTGSQQDFEAAVYSNLLANLQSWFEEFTDRLTFWYRKKTRLRLFLLGTVLGLIINVDSIQLFSFFSSYPETRQAYLTFYQKNAASLSKLAIRVDSLANRVNADPSLPRDGLLKQLQPLAHTADSLRTAYQLPVGFQYSVFKAGVPSNFMSITYKLIGILLTGFAASFGAPFWFDLLRKAYSQ